MQQVDQTQMGELEEDEMRRKLCLAMGEPAARWVWGVGLWQRGVSRSCVKDATLPVDENFEAHMVKIISAGFGISD